MTSLKTRGKVENRKLYGQEHFMVLQRMIDRTLVEDRPGYLGSWGSFQWSYEFLPESHSLLIFHSYLLYIYICTHIYIYIYVSVCKYKVYDTQYMQCMFVWSSFPSAGRNARWPSVTVSAHTWRATAWSTQIAPAVHCCPMSRFCCKFDFWRVIFCVASWYPKQLVLSGWKWWNNHFF